MTVAACSLMSCVWAYFFDGFPGYAWTAWPTLTPTCIHPCTVSSNSLLLLSFLVWKNTCLTCRHSCVQFSESEGEICSADQVLCLSSASCILKEDLCLERVTCRTPAKYVDCAGADDDGKLIGRGCFTSWQHKQKAEIQMNNNNYKMKRNYQPKHT